MKNNILTSLKKLPKNYIRCGILGWCIEILFTSLTAGPKNNRALMGKTSIFMFPIYGAACLFAPLYPLLKRFAWPIRGLCYMNLMIKEAKYWNKQIEWLEERFPDGKYQVQNLPGGKHLLQHEVLGHHNGHALHLTEQHR